MYSICTLIRNSLRSRTSLFSKARIAGLFLAVSTATSAHAEVVGIGVTRGGANPAIGAAIASIVSEHGGMQMRTQVFSSGMRYAPLMDIGKVEFGVANVSQFTLLMEGRFTETDQPKPNLRLAASLMPFRGGFLVKADSDIHSFADLKGKRIAAGFPGQLLASVMHKAFLANGGLTYDDVKSVPAATMRSHWELLKEGRIDGVMMSVGSGVVKELEASIGKLRYLPMDDSPESLEKLQSALPGAYFATVLPSKKLDGATEKFETLAYDYGLWVSKDVEDDLVYDVVKALYENSDAFKSVNPLTRQYNPEQTSRKQDVPYHPGALRYFNDVGLPVQNNF